MWPLVVFWSDLFARCYNFFESLTNLLNWYLTVFCAFHPTNNNKKTFRYDRFCFIPTSILDAKRIVILFFSKRFVSLTLTKLKFINGIFEFIFWIKYLVLGQAVWKRNECRIFKAKESENAEFSVLNEHFERFFNTEYPNGIVFTQPEGKGTWSTQAKSSPTWLEILIY